MLAYYNICIFMYRGEYLLYNYLKQRRVHLYILGLVIMTLGIALSIQAQLGTSPFDAVLVGLYRTFGLTIGSWEIVVGGSMILCNALLVRKRPEFFAILTSLITGIGIDSWLSLIRHFIYPTSIVGQWITMIISFLFIRLGVSIYLLSFVAPNPIDRSIVIMSDITGLSMTYTRAIISIILVIIALFFNGAVGIGTLINALFVGYIITLCLPLVEKLFIKESVYD